MRAKDFIPPSKPRNPVVQQQQTSGAGKHRNRKKEQQQGYEKHKGKGIAEAETVLDRYPYLSSIKKPSWFDQNNLAGLKRYQGQLEWKMNSGEASQEERYAYFELLNLIKTKQNEGLNELAPTDDRNDGDEEDDAMEAKFTVFIKGKPQTGTVRIFPGDTTEVEYHLNGKIYIKSDMENVDDYDDFIENAAGYIQEIIQLKGDGHHFVEEGVAERVRDPLDWDEGNTEPPNNFAVYINGKKWKVFKGRGQFAGDFKEMQHYRQLRNWAESKSKATGKKWEVYITGEPANESVEENTNIPFDQCPHCRGPIFHESLMMEKQDACYHKVRSRYKVWPSAYASGALVQCRKKGAKNWGNKSK